MIRTSDNENQKEAAARELSEVKRHFATNFDIIINATGIGLWDWDLVTGKIVHSGQLERIAGYEVGEMPDGDQSARDLLIHPDDRKGADAVIEACRIGRLNNYETEFRIRCKDGGIKWVQDRGAAALRDENGIALRIVGMFYDVDRLKETNEAMSERFRIRQQDLQAEINSTARDLEKARRTSEALFDANPNMNMIFDDRFQAIDCNPASVEYFGMPSKEALLARIGDILTNAIPEYQPNGQKSVTFAQRVSDTVRDGVNEFETVLVFHGKEAPMRVVMKRIDYPDSFAIAVYQMDLTEIKQTEKALLRQDKLLQAVNSVASLLMESDQDTFGDAMEQCLALLSRSLGTDRAYIWSNSTEEGKLYANQISEWIAQERAEYLDYGDRRFLYEEVFPDWQQLIDNDMCINAAVTDMNDTLESFAGFQDVKAALIIPIVFRGQFWGFLGFDDCHDGSRSFTAAEEKIMRSAGMLIAAAVLRNQINESLVIAKEAALEGSRAKSDFLSRMSHEIRTPMNAIIGMTAIARKATDIPRIQACLDKIDVASRQLLELINDVLDMSKIEANKLELAENEFDFEKMMQNVFNVVQMRVLEKGQDLSFDFQDMFRRKIICDELRLSQVLINLLSNAVKFTPESGSISVKMRYKQKRGDIYTLRVEVRDTGIGISEEQQRRLFTAFEQADVSTTRQYGGTGLGLTICKKIVQLMGGDIFLESQLGQGSVFSFLVDFRWGSPILEEELAPPIAPDRRVLVVDDSDDVLVYFKNILSDFSLHCDTASDGRQALALAARAKAESNPYSIIFIDWQMPVMSGRDTVRGLLELTDEETALVMISTADWSDVERDISGLGVEHFLPKPVFPSSLYNMIVTLSGAEVDNAAAQEAAREYDWMNKRILIVEDIEINREIIISLLQDTGVGFDYACDGIEAVEKWQRWGDLYDLILMDMQMPRMDGLDATREIRRSGVHHCSSIPIIAMTANAFKEDVERCLNAGMDGHIAKPIDMDSLYLTLSRYLG